ncbi:MAG: hypothetical protein IT372_32555 [Polyangiaceae bacterium]|nr:hypothetical protein [Polyangiaceae bacterium]
MIVRTGIVLSSILAGSLVTLAAAPARASALDAAHEIAYNVAPASNTWGSPCSISWTGYTANTNGACLFTLSLQHDDPTITTSLISTWWGSNNPSGPVYYSQIVAENHFTNITNVADIEAGDLLAVRYLSGGSYIGYVMIVEFAPELIAGSSTRYLVGIIDATKTPHGSTDSRWQADAGGVHDWGVGYGDIFIDADENGAIAAHTWSTGTGSYYTQATRQMVAGRFVR